MYPSMEIVFLVRNDGEDAIFRHNGNTYKVSADLIVYHNDLVWINGVHITARNLYNI